jgi:hypothetical protein
MSSKYLLETSLIDGYLLEDGSGVLLLEPSFSTSFSGSLNLFIHGFITQTNNINLTIIGHESFNNNLNLFIRGQDSINDQFTLFISTINVFASFCDLFIHGIDNLSDNFDLFIHGSIVKNDNIDLLILGSDSFFETLDLFIHGPELISGLLNLTVLNLIPVNDNLNLFIKGPTQITDNINLFIKGPILKENSLDLFIFGYVESILSTLFLKTPDNDIATSRSLHIYGSPSGVSFNFAGQGIDLFVKSSFEDGVYPPTTSAYVSLFMPVLSGSVFSSGYWPLFLASDTSINNGIDLYISTHEKIASGFIDLFIARIPDFPGEEGFTPINTYQTLFLKTIVGETDILDLFVSGVFATSSDNIDCFIEGVFTINDHLNLVLFGISGIVDNNLDLFIYGIDHPNDSIELFVRGY